MKKTFTYGSVCSGIESVSVAWHHLPLHPLWFSEIDPFPCQVLAYHWSDVPDQGDMRLLADKITNGDIPAPDILAGGTPCQSFSVAGIRQGLTDPRGQLTLAYIRLADAIDLRRKEENRHATILLWENVPGVLSDTGNAFGHILAGLAGTDFPLLPGAPPTGKKSSPLWRWSEKHARPVPKWSRAGCVYGARRSIAWRVLDSQYFGLAQRRKPVYLIAGAGTGFDPAAILFEPGCLPGTVAQSAGEKPSAAGAFTADPDSADLLCNTQCITQHTPATHSSTCHTPVPDPAHSPVICIAGNIIGRTPKNGSHGRGVSQELCYTLDTSHTAHAVATDNMIRRLMPVEYERLLGFPDHYTQIPWRGKPAQKCPDALRYKALGNAMAVPVITWLGERLYHHLCTRS